MSSYVVLARKWRPSQFSDIVGQGPIVRTLMNAIRGQRVHQAYLLTGSRGIGKTSIARIFAKALRCPNAKWVDDSGATLGAVDGSASPEALSAPLSKDAWLQTCDECSSCREIASGTSVDVIEIDGASNNGVDAVREIRENAKYLPNAGERKIYIIDEVHMLTTAAFNALLKTLEEPPPHVVFMFATTEPHKIPATILSRVQRFDLRRPTMVQIQDRLIQVTRAENIQAEPAALSLLARAAEGSLRDSLSLLDQVIAFSGSKITAQTTRDSIGLIEGQTLLGILRGVLARKPLDAIAHVDQAFRQGHDLRVLSRSLLEFLYGAILARIGSARPDQLELAAEEWEELKALSELRELEELELIFQVIHQGIEWIARSPQPKIVLDVILIKCATAEALVPLSEASGAPTSGGASGGGGARPVNAAAPAPVSSPALATARPIAPSIRTEAAVPAPASPTEIAATYTANHAAAIAASLTTAAAPVSVEVSAPALASPPTPVPTATVAAATAPAAAATGPATWESFIAQVRRTRPLLASMLERGVCDTLPPRAAERPANLTADQDAVTIQFKSEDGYFREQLQARAYAEQMSQLVREYFGRHIRVQIELKNIGESLAVKREREHEEKIQAARDAALNHPIIAEARALFGGELSPIELREAPNGAPS